jgi:hypothetical protein
MDTIPQASLFLGIIPALIFLYLGIKGYEGHYKEKYVFLTFVVGIVIGFISIVVRILINPFPLLIFYIIIFAFFDQLLKTMILNLRRFHNQTGTVIYGLSLGLGYGSVFTPFLLVAHAASNQSYAYSLIWVAIGSFGFILFHGAVGTIIGYGIFIKKLMRYLIYVIILQIPLNVIFDFSRLSENPYSRFFHIGLILYGGVIFLYVIKKILPRILNRKSRRGRTKRGIIT